MRTFAATPAATRPATANSANATEVASPVAGTYFAGLVAAGVGSLEGHNARVLGGGHGHGMAVTVGGGAFRGRLAGGHFSAS